MGGDGIISKLDLAREVLFQGLSCGLCCEVEICAGSTVCESGSSCDSERLGSAEDSVGLATVVCGCESGWLE